MFAKVVGPLETPPPPRAEGMEHDGSFHLTVNEGTNSSELLCSGGRLPVLPALLAALN